MFAECHFCWHIKFQTLICRLFANQKKERKFNAAGTFSDRTSSVKCNEKAIENKRETEAIS